MNGRKLEKIARISLYTLLLIAVVWAYKAGSFDFIINNPGDLVYLGTEHLRLVGISCFLAILIAVPLGIFVTRPKYKKYDWIVINFANVGQTIPTLAVLALIMSYFGLGWETAVIALWFNSLLPILRNTVAGIENVHHSVIDAGEGMGMTKLQILMKLEIPNALPVMLAGIRTAVVINIGSAALAFLIGGGGLGDLIFTGIAISDTGIMLSGAIPIIILAIAADFLLGIFEKLVVSKGIRRNLEII
jgi:osmoprotectant transport system permease protein